MHQDLKKKTVHIFSCLKTFLGAIGECTLGERGSGRFDMILQMIKINCNTQKEQQTPPHLNTNTHKFNIPLKSKQCKIFLLLNVNIEMCYGSREYEKASQPCL